MTRFENGVPRIPLWLAVVLALTAGVAALRAQSTRPGGTPGAGAPGAGAGPGAPSTPAATRPSTRPATRPDTQPGAPIVDMQAKKDRIAEIVAMHVANQHGAPLWRQTHAVEADIVVEFGGANVLEGTILHEQRRGRTRLTLKDGPVLTYDGKSFWVSPANATVPEPGARLHLLTWASFLVGPVRLQDAAAVPTAHEYRPLQGQPRDSIELHFRDLPPEQANAHYVVYSIPKQLTVQAMASIVAYGKTPAEALAQPRCITFEKLEQVGGITLPTSWTIWNWNKGTGLEGEPLGHVTISNIKFIIPPERAFEKPSDAREDSPSNSSATQSSQ